MAKLEGAFYDRGREAVCTLWAHWRERPEIIDPRDPEFARGVLDEIVDRLVNSADVDKEIREFSEAAAEQVTNANRTIFEILQNADDLGSEYLTLSVRRKGNGELLAVHGGKPVVAADVIAMTLAFLSLKRDDARSKGRFGIGLKTLNQLGSKLCVHCPPYHFEVERGLLRKIDPSPPINGVYNPSESETLLKINLDSEYNIDDVLDWVSEIDARQLVFLDYLRELSVIDARTGKPVSTVRLECRTLPAVAVELRPGAHFKAERVQLTDEGKPGRTWTRYSIDYPVPETHRRAHKATGAETQLAVAISKYSEPGILAAGLPLDFADSLPVSLSAQFDPDLARRGLQQRQWNRWLFERLAELIGGVSLLCFQDDPQSGWQTVPLEEENASTDAWTDARISELIEAVQERIRSKLRFNISGAYVELAELSYVEKGLEGLVSEADQQLLAPDYVPLSRKFCDRQGRWHKVLEELGESHRIGIWAAVALLELDDDIFGTRSENWFIRLADAALNAGLNDRLGSLRSILAADGSRHAPKGDILLVHDAGTENISSRLGLQKQISAGYLSNRTSEHVRNWLSTFCVASSSDSSSYALNALSRRTGDPLYLDDTALTMLRDALRKVDDAHRTPLASAVGRVICVDGYEYRKGSKHTCRVRPALAYLPTPIAKDTGGWAAAAKTTEGLYWIDPRYGDLLRMGRAGEGAKRLFTHLGAKAGPRLISQDFRVPIGWEIPVAQAEAIQSLPQRATHLEYDYVSPDLEAVVADIVRQRLDGKRRGRSRALIETLMRDWDQHLSDHADAHAVYQYYTWKTVGVVPATWLALLASEPWLSSKSKRKVAPREMAIETAATKLTRGTKGSQFVYELSEVDSAHPIVRALEIKGTPPASELLEEIIAIRNRFGDRARIEDIYPLYAALTALISRERTQFVGDVSVFDLRRQFETYQLVMTTVGWQSPSASFRGRPIFRSLRGFVRESGHLAALWHLLDLREPGSADCIDVLEQIAASASAPSTDEVGLMVDVFRKLAGQDDLSTRAIAKRLETLPLWTSRGWQQTRPIYAVRDQTLESQLGENLSIWLPGCAIEGLANLPKYLGLEVLSDHDFTVAPGVDVDTADDLTSYTFKAAVACLRAELGRKSQELWNSIDWTALSAVELMWAPNLIAEAKIGRQKLSVPRVTHVDAKQTLYFVDRDDLERPEIGERILDSFALGRASPMLGFAWSFAWREAELHGPPTDELALASDLDELDDPLDHLGRKGGKAIGKRLFAGVAAGKQKGRGKRILPVPRERRLKDFDGATISNVTITAGSKSQRDLKPAKRGVKMNPSGLKGTRSPLAAPPPTPIKAWGEKERERLGFELLAAALKQIDDIQLEDFSALHGIGADSIDDLERYFELKVHSGEAPDEVRFEASEFERAVKAKKDYFLAVISGLEEGKETLIRIFADPVRTLPWRRNSQIKLGGIRTPGSKALTIAIETPKGQGKVPSV